MRRMNSKSEKEREREGSGAKEEGEGEQPQHVRLVIIISATLGQWLKWCSRCRCRFNLHNEVVFIVAAPIGSALYLASRRQDYLCPPLYLPPLPSYSISLSMCVLCSEPLGPDPKQDREMKSHCQTQTLSPTRPTRPFAISGIIIVIISGSGWSA